MGLVTGASVTGFVVGTGGLVFGVDTVVVLTVVDVTVVLWRAGRPVGYGAQPGLNAVSSRAISDSLPLPKTPSMMIF